MNNPKENYLNESANQDYLKEWLGSSAGQNFLNAYLNGPTGQKYLKGYLAGDGKGFLKNLKPSA